MANTASNDSQKDIKEVRNDTLKAQVGCFDEGSILEQAYNSMAIYVYIVDSEKRIVFANKMLIKLLGLEDLNQLVGKLPEEFIKCEKMDDKGCLNYKGCVKCALLDEDEHKKKAKILLEKNGYWDVINISLNVSPIEIEGNKFFAVSFTDISDTVRRRQLERIFFHDILNTTGALKGIVQLLKEEVPEIIRSEVEFVEETFSNLIDEIQSQKQVVDAENDELSLEIATVKSMDILNSIYRIFEKHKVAQGKIISIDSNSVNVTLESDSILLKRILSNMLKNALEATDEGGTVRLGCNIISSYYEILEFWVNNNKVIPKDAQRHIFSHPFSTKSERRGLGTYSIKLLGQKYLKGCVGFNSNENEGTTFYIRVPLKYEIEAD